MRTLEQEILEEFDCINRKMKQESCSMKKVKLKKKKFCRGTSDRNEVYSVNTEVRK